MTKEVADITHGSNDSHQRNARKGTEVFSELHTNVKTVLEKTGIDGGLDNVVFVETRIRAIAIGSCLYSCM